MAHIISQQLETEFHFNTEIVDSEEVWKSFKNEMFKQHRTHKKGLRAGDPFPSEVLPKKIKVLGKRKPTNGFFGASVGLTVDHRIKDIVEANEPGVHRFHPVELVMQNGELLETQHYLLNCCTKVDAIDPERSNVRILGYVRELRKSIDISFDQIEKFPQYRYEALGSKRDLFIFQNRIQDRGMWWDHRINEHFFSDEVYDAAIAAGVQGFREFPRVEEV